MKSLNNKNFMSILSECCSDGHIDDDLLNYVLSFYWPYNLVFHRVLEEDNE